MAIIPMICVEKVSESARLLCDLFQWESTHGGEEFDELIDVRRERVLWLHTLNAPEHARFAANELGHLGRGLAIYVFVDDIDAVHGRTRKRI